MKVELIPAPMFGSDGKPTFFELRADGNLVGLWFHKDHVLPTLREVVRLAQVGSEVEAAGKRLEEQLSKRQPSLFDAKAADEQIRKMPPNPYLPRLYNEQDVVLLRDQIMEAWRKIENKEGLVLYVDHEIAPLIDWDIPFPGGDIGTYTILDRISMLSGVVDIKAAKVNHACKFAFVRPYVAVKPPEASGPLTKSDNQQEGSGWRSKPSML